jgi:tetratricopeptide (TPR) repeat protein
MPTEVTHLPLWQQAWAWFEANKKPALWGAGGVVVVGLVVGFLVYRHDETAIAASEALSNVLVPQLTGANRSNPTDAYLKVASSYTGTRAGGRALLLAAGGLFVEGKYDEAREQFERFNREYSDSRFRGEALLGIAACLDAQNKTNQAMTAYRDLIDRRPTDYVLPQAQFALARLYVAQDKPELARSLFEDVERNNPYSSLGSEAGIRLEEMKTKYPALFAPPTPAPTNASPLRAISSTNATPVKVPAPTNAAPSKAGKR